jgi:hypothetical protein
MPSRAVHDASAVALVQTGSTGANSSTLPSSHGQRQEQRGSSALEREGDLMVFWIVIAVVVVVLTAVAWWSSGRSRGRAGTGDGALDHMSTKRQGYGPGPNV